MDCLIQNQTLLHLLVEYGSLILFFALILGIIALPIPEETMMVIAGVLMRKQILLIPTTLIAAIAGSIIGISVSYCLGRTGGAYLVHKYGKWVGLSQERLQQTRDWFHHFGKWSLFVGYFIPGVRHFTGFTAGTTELEFKIFALYAYTGAVIWVFTFLFLGYYFGNICLEALETLDASAVALILIVGLIVALYVVKKMIFKKR